MPEVTTLPRYTSRPLPRYRYVPGRTPHPVRDPDGHSHGVTATGPDRFAAAEWATCAEYLYGIDLFNHGYWWEAHDSLEQCWIAAGRTTPTGQWLQGLILVSVACLKNEQGFADVARRMARDGLDKFPRDAGTLLGVDVVALRADILAHLHDGAAAPVIHLHPEPMPA